MMFFPKILFQTSSRYNPDIRVVREWGGNKLLVNGSRQSGPYIRTLWQRAFRACNLRTPQDIRSILVLGLGGGTVIELLSGRYPRADITAVDIDQTIIDIAKQYFQIDTISRLRMLRKDASKYIHTTRHFDMIIVDLFIGREIPSFVSSVSFYRNLKKMLRRSGVLMLNFLRELEYQKKADALLLRLKRTFPEVDDFPIANNRFFFCHTP